MKNSGVILAAGLATLTGAGGFFLGKGNSSAADGDNVQATISSNAQGIAKGEGGQATKESGVRPNLRGYELSRNPSRGLETLMAELRKSPMAMMDFESLFGIWDMVQYLDGNELSYLMTELDGMSGGQELMAVRMMLLNRWATQDGQAAMESVFSQENQGMMQGVSAMGAMMGWMRTDPEAAYQWVQANGDKLSGARAMGMSKEQLEGMYFANLARTDFDGTMAKLDGMDGKMQNVVIAQLAQGAVGDLERRDELMSYLKGKGDDDLLESARRNIVTQMAWQDPEGALAFIESENPGAEQRDELEQSLSSMWSHSDPQGALEWQSEKLQGTENAGEQIADTFGRWVSQDETEAAQWLASQGEEFQTDSVFQNAGQQLLGQQNYERSAEWYGQVLDQDERASNYQGLYAMWSREDEAAANEWRAQLPEDERDLIGPSLSEDSKDAPAVLTLPEG